MKLKFWKRTKPVPTVNVSLNPVTVNHKITYAPKPPQQKPVQMTVVYCFNDGTEYKTFVPISNGMSTWTEAIPGYVQHNIERVSHMRYDFTYQDGSMWI